MNSVYPVGSLFFCTQSTCPLQTLGIGTWQNVGTSIITSVNTNVPVKGTGAGLGLLSGGDIGDLTLNGSSNSSYNVRPYESGNLSDKYSTGIANGTAYPLGVHTDANKSGIVGTITRTSLVVNIFKRTA